jgi:hypothetical protein
MEEGFRGKEEYSSLGMAHYAALVNSIASADTSRISNFFSNEDGFAHIRSAKKNSGRPTF